MNFASGSHHGLRFIKEGAFGETPANPAMRALRHTSCSLVLNKDSFTSNELRKDAQISDMRSGVKQISGDIGIEFSYGEYDDFLAAAVRGEWNGDILKAGVTVPYFTIESIFADIDRYETFTGCAINNLSLQIQTNAMVTGTLGIIGKSAKFAQTPTATSELPSHTAAPLDGFNGDLREGGVTVATITSISLSIENGIEAANVLGSDEAAALVAGRINITGSISAYFSNMDLLSKFIEEAESEIEVTLGTGGPGSYRIHLPRIKYSGGSNPVDGEGPIMLDMPFQALLDECTGTNIIIERIPEAAVVAQPCTLTWAGTSFTESVRNDGSFDNSILVSLTGGNGKSFAGYNGMALPGVAFRNLPTGLTGSVTRLSDMTCKVELKGKAVANDPADGGNFTIQFMAAAFSKGFCNCAGDTVANATQTMNLTFAAGDPLPVDAMLTGIQVLPNEADLAGAPNGNYVTINS